MSRVPSVCRILCAVLPKVPAFCGSVHPTKAVAQGAAIRSAVLSGRVPAHALRNVLMLDVLPHVIGVSSSGESFVEILKRNAPLPAECYSTVVI